jgi:hypothetical protein
MNMKRLSNHFFLDEFTHSQIAVREEIDNTPNAEHLANLSDLAMALEDVRSLLDCPIYISSGYRSPKLNVAAKGSKSSAHCRGMAADFTARQFGTPEDVCRKIEASGLEFDQLILEFFQWTHFSIDPRMRRQVLTAHRANGQVSYTQGIG